MTWAATVFRNPETPWLSSEADRRGSNNVVGFKSDMENHTCLPNVKACVLFDEAMK